MAHVVDAHGICEHSDLPPDQCGGCTGAEARQASMAAHPAGTFRELADYSENPHSAYTREFNAATRFGATRNREQWTPDEDRALVLWSRSTKPASALAAELGRTVAAVYVRRNALRERGMIR